MAGRLQASQLLIDDPSMGLEAVVAVVAPGEEPGPAGGPDDDDETQHGYGPTGRDGLGLRLWLGLRPIVGGAGSGTLVLLSETGEDGGQAAVEVTPGEEVVAELGDRGQCPFRQEGAGAGHDLSAALGQRHQHHDSVILLGIAHPPGVPEFLGELAGWQR